MAIHLFKAFLSQCYRLSRWLHDTAANNNWTCGQGNLLRQVKCSCQIDDISFKQKRTQNSIRYQYHQPPVWKAQKPPHKGNILFQPKASPIQARFTKNLLISSREDWSKEGVVCSFPSSHLHSKAIPNGIILSGAEWNGILKIWNYQTKSVQMQQIKKRQHLI